MLLTLLFFRFSMGNMRIISNFMRFSVCNTRLDEKRRVFFSIFFNVCGQRSHFVFGFTDIAGSFVDGASKKPLL
jgi:hypothetical protein